MKIKNRSYSLLSVLTLILGLFLLLGISPAHADGTSLGASGIDQSESVAEAESAPVLGFSGIQPRAGSAYPIDVSSPGLAGSHTGYTVTAGNEIQLTEAGAIYTLTGSTSTYRVNVMQNCTIILNECHIQSPSTTTPLHLNGKTVALMLENSTTNSMDASLTINPLDTAAGINTTGATLTIEGTGKLVATGGRDGAGIGSGRNGSSGNITIYDGKIEATGGINGAGIGGGKDGAGGNITIYDGDITATGGRDGAGIGGGKNGAGGNITIYDGDITATGGDSGAGIGGGNGGAGSNISIYSGEVKTNGGKYGGAGIGGGKNGAGGTITIYSGTIEAIGGNGDFAGGSYAHGGGAGIGGGMSGAGGDIFIGAGTNLTASGGDGGVNVSGTASYGGGGAAIGGGGGVSGSSGGGGGGGSGTISLPAGNPPTGFNLTGGTGAKDGTTQKGGDGVPIGSGGDGGTISTTGANGAPYTPNINAPSVTPTIEIDYINETLTDFIAGETYSINQKIVTFPTTPTNPTFPIDPAWIGGSPIPIILVGDRTASPATANSLPQSRTIPARPAAPAVTGHGETSMGAADGRITGVNSTMEYKPSSGSTWTPVTGTSITGLVPGSYEVRVAASNTLQNFEGNSTTVTIASSTIVLVTGVTLNKTTTAITVSDTETLTATISPSSATDQRVSWVSSNPAVATVDTSGEVTAISVGTTNIIVTTSDGSFTKTCAVTVNPIAVTGVGLDKTAISLLPNQSESLTATVFPSDSANRGVSWISSDTNVATVDGNGEVTGKNVGNATITVTTSDGGYTATCAVTVTPATYTIDGSTTYTFTGEGNIRFRVIEPPMADVQSITVDGILLDPQNYTLEQGSTIVTLKNSYLKTLSNKTYAVTVQFVNGQAGITLQVAQSTGGGSTGSTGSGSTSGGNTTTGGGTTTADSGNKAKAFDYTSSGSSSSSTAANPDDANYNPQTGGIIPTQSDDGNPVVAIIGIGGIIAAGIVLYVIQHKRKKRQ